MSDPSFPPQSFPPPLPLPTLSYSMPAMKASRPGLITAVGVLSIVLGIMGIFSAFGTALYAVGMYAIPRIPAFSAPTASTAVPLTAPVATPLSVADVGVAVNTLKQGLALDANQTRELYYLLRKHGREVLGVDEDNAPLTPADVRALLKQSATPSVESDAGPQVSTRVGVMTIMKDSAQFTATDGSRRFDTSASQGTDQTVNLHSPSTTKPTPPLPFGSGSGAMTYNYSFQASASPLGSQSVSYTPSSQPTALTPAQVQAIVSTAMTKSGRKLTPGQTASLQQLLSSPSQDLVASTGPTAVVAARVPQFGDTTITFDTGAVVIIAPSGMVTSTFSPKVLMNSLKMSFSTVLAVAIESIVLAALAVFLILVGVLTLRGSTSAPRMLRIYAYLKIPISIAADVTLAIATYEFFGAISGSNSGFRLTFIVWRVVGALVSVAFPIGVLIVLRLRSVRDYYNSVR